MNLTLIPFAISGFLGGCMIGAGLYRLFTRSFPIKTKLYGLALIIVGIGMQILLFITL